MAELQGDYFPLWNLGYRCNPFRALTREEWYDVARLPEPLLEILHQLPPLTQILGHKGSGKTSTLIAIERQLSSHGQQTRYEYLPPGSNRYRARIQDIEVLLLDEAQRLSQGSLKKLLALIGRSDAAQPRIILSSHVNLAIIAREYGVRAETIDLKNHTDSFAERLVEDRLRYFQLPGQQGVRLTPDALSLVITHCGTDFRRLEQLLYEAYQTWKQPGPIPVSHLKSIIEAQS